MKTALILAYYYPPLGGAGVQRIAKLIKYLPSLDYEPIVVAGTGLPESQQTFPLDDALNNEVKHAKTYRITFSPLQRRTLRLFNNRLTRKIPGISYRHWIAAARKACLGAIGDQKPDVIFVTVSPFPAAALAAGLAAKLQIPWVLDMRDPWALDPINVYSSRWHHRLDLREMHRACRSASAIIMNTPRSLQALRGAFTDLPAEKLFCITNGWDADDFAQIRHAPQKGRCPGPLTIVHTGLFHTRLAVRVDPTSREELNLNGNMLKRSICYCPGKPHLLARTPYYLLKAIRLLLDEHKLSPQDIRLILAGADTPEDRQLAQRFALEELVEFKGYLTHDESIRQLALADLLFLPLHVPQASGYPLIVPGKTYEYLAAAKPILALTPDGDARDFITRSGMGIICDPTNPKQVAHALLSVLARHQSPEGLQMCPDEQFLEQFDRRKLAKQFADVLDFARNQRGKKAS